MYRIPHFNSGLFQIKGSTSPLCKFKVVNWYYISKFLSEYCRFWTILELIKEHLYICSFKFRENRMVAMVSEGISLKCFNFYLTAIYLLIINVYTNKFFWIYIWNYRSLKILKLCLGCMTMKYYIGKYIFCCYFIPLFVRNLLKIKIIIMKYESNGILFVLNVLIEITCTFFVLFCFVLFARKLIVYAVLLLWSFYSAYNMFCTCIDWFCRWFSMVYHAIILNKTFQNFHTFSV